MDNKAQQHEPHKQRAPVDRVRQHPEIYKPVHCIA